MRTTILMRTTAVLLAAIITGMAAWLLAAPVPAIGLTAMLGAIVATLGIRAPKAEPVRPVAIEPPVPNPDFLELFAAIDEPLLRVDKQQVVYANAPARTLLGAHIVGEDIRLAIRHPAASDRLTGRVRGDERPIELVGLGERDRHWHLTVHDLSDGSRLVRLTDRSGEHAAEKMRVDFVANASHELRTPLSTLLGFIETLEDRNAAEDAPTRARFLKIMFDEAKRMQQLVDDLISLSRIEADKYSVPQKAVPLAPLLASVKQAQEAATEAVGRIRIMIDGELPPVTGDAAQLSQLVHNLVGNAIKYGRSDEPVLVSARVAAGGTVALVIADKGDGIAPEHLPRLTERFYRVDAGRSRAMGGTGLGLAIVKHIVERHRGRLDIVSTLGVGPTVTVLLPALPASLS
jgi:two-component system phosphate regulon sensor histidine kinase PhoR